MEKAVRVFVPHQCLLSESGLLFGSIDKSKGIVVITCLFGQNAVPDTMLTWPKQTESTYSVIGTWDNMKDQIQAHGFQSRKFSHNYSSWLSLSASSSGGAPCVLLQGEWDCDTVILLMYDPESLLSSYVLCVEEPFSETTSVGVHDTNLRHLVKTLCAFRSLKAGSIVDNSDVVCFIPSMQQGLCQRYLNKFTWFITICLRRAIFLFELIMESLRLNRGLVKTIATTPTVGSELSGKYQEFRSVFCGTNKPNNVGKRLGLYNVLWRSGIDILLGVLFMLLLRQYGFHDVIANQIMVLAETVVEQLQLLLQWMMGVPAGLKLNSQLDQVLGRFFLYHIYLWTGYLSLLQPVLSDILWLISALGSLGISLELCLLQDLLSMMTLHIYCFYVYAARLYNLQIWALSSLLQLFRGKKWNVLRKRVDSATYDVDQLFVGTLLFTILLFLLPTTALYYVVFTILRLLILSVQGCLHKCVILLTTFPVYSALLYIVGSHSLAGDMSVQMLSSSRDCNTLTLDMQVSPVGWSRITELSRTRQRCEVTYSWTDLAKKILIGELVYPWIERVR